MLQACEGALFSSLSAVDILPGVLCSSVVGMVPGISISNGSTLLSRPNRVFVMLLRNHEFMIGAMQPVIPLSLSN